MVCWTLFPLLLLSSPGFGLSSSAEGISAHVHVAANDQLIVFARNRDGAFHFTLNPSETSTLILRLDYTSIQTEVVRSLSIPANPSTLQPIQLVFIGGPRNSTERKLFHAKLQIDESNKTLFVIHLWNTSITSLSSVGMECALGMHPLGTHVVIVGDRGGYIYDMEESSGYYWSSWEGSIDNFYPKAISVTMDKYVFVGVNVQTIDTILPSLYTAEFDSKGIISAPLKEFVELPGVEVTSIKSPMSIALHGLLYGDGLVIAFGFPSVDIVLLYVRISARKVVSKVHKSLEKGINFGQAVILTDNQTYGVLSSALPTSPWSTGRVQVRSSFFAARGSKAHRSSCL
jgi:hypothetical protein